MTNTDFDMPPGQPDDNEPRDALDFIDQTVAQITDADIEESLRKTLHRAGYGSGQDTDAAQDFITMCGEHLDARAPEVAAIAQLANINMLATAQAALRRVQDEIRAARQEAARILDEAREEADRALSEAAKIVRDARAQAERITADARREAEQAVAEAVEKCEAITGGSGDQRADQPVTQPILAGSVQKMWTVPQEDTSTLPLLFVVPSGEVRWAALDQFVSPAQRMLESLGRLPGFGQVTSDVALDEIELYAEVLSAVATSDGPLSPSELDTVLGVRAAEDGQRLSLGTAITGYPLVDVPFEQLAVKARRRDEPGQPTCDRDYRPGKVDVQFLGQRNEIMVLETFVAGVVRSAGAGQSAGTGSGADPVKLIGQLARLELTDRERGLLRRLADVHPLRASAIDDKERCTDDYDPADLVTARMSRLAVGRVRVTWRCSAGHETELSVRVGDTFAELGDCPRCGLPLRSGRSVKPVMGRGSASFGLAGDDRQTAR